MSDEELTLPTNTYVEVPGTDVEVMQQEGQSITVRYRKKGKFTPDDDSANTTL